MSTYYHELMGGNHFLFPDYNKYLNEACATVDALRDKNARLKAEAEKLRGDSVSRAQLNLAVNRSCSCGGRPPGTPSTCPACEVWHRLFGDLAPPKPVPIAAPSPLSWPSGRRPETTFGAQEISP
jgi:hypothetical protein